MRITVLLNFGKENRISIAYNHEKERCAKDKILLHPNQIFENFLLMALSK